MRTEETFQVGAEVRERRRQLGLSVRALAARASISPAYVSAIETSHNPSTGRAPALGLAIARRLAEALGVDVTTLIGQPEPPRGLGEHVLVYITSASTTSVVTALDLRYRADVDHWLHIVDPRSRGLRSGSRVTACRFPLGSSPYATRELDPDALIAAVDREVARLAPAWRGRRVGLLVEDCSAVMRYLSDASTEVALEARWHDAVCRIWRTRLGAPPPVDVCAYRCADLEALGLTIGQLGTALDLIERHDEVLLIDEHEVLRGAPAIKRILMDVRPSGTSRGPWEQLSAAAAQTLAGVSAG